MKWRSCVDAQKIYVYGCDAKVSCARKTVIKLMEMEKDVENMFLWLFRF